jgi:hypothetical protein
LLSDGFDFFSMSQGVLRDSIGWLVAGLPERLRAIRKKGLEVIESPLLDPLGIGMGRFGIASSSKDAPEQHLISRGMIGEGA